MKWFVGICVALLLATSLVDGQIVGPDEEGIRYFFFSNYSAVYLLHRLFPSIAFHPVLGGAENTYIRYQNWATFNLTTLSETDSDNNVVAQVNTGELTWHLDTQSKTLPDGNLYTLGNITTTAPNGAVISVLCETWSKGNDRLYGTLWNNVTADQTELSFIVSKWPFKNNTNLFKMSLQFDIDGDIQPFLPTNPTAYQKKVVLSSATTTFTTTVMTYGILDDVLTKFTYSFSILSSTSVNFVLISKAFNNTFLYDPNFSVLLQTKPNCDSLGGCAHGTCVNDNQCKCLRGYLLPDCVKYNVTLAATQSSDDSDRDGKSISKEVIIGAAVGGFVLVVGATCSVILIQQRRSHNRRKRVLTIVENNNKKPLSGII